MGTLKNSSIIHMLAIAAGVLSIVAASAPALGIPTYFVGLIGVIIAVLIYIGNQMDALGSTTDAPPRVIVTDHAPTPPSPATPVAVSVAAKK